jgi:tetratricopeptide (TPR) repeat protein
MAWLARQAAIERDRASEESDTARRVTAFTAGLFELANPAALGSRDVTARELLDAGVRRLEAEAANERADVRAALFEAAGNAYRGLGEYSRSKSLLERAVALRRSGDGPMTGCAGAVAAESRAARARRGRVRRIAEQLLREALALQSRRDEPAIRPPTDVESRSISAAVLRLQSRLDEARADHVRYTLEECRDTKTRRPNLCRSRDATCLVAVYSAQGRLEDAERELSRVRSSIQRELYGESNDRDARGQGRSC